MRPLLAAGVTALLLSGGAQAASGDSICPNLPNLPFLPSIPCLELPPLPGLGGVVSPSMPSGAIPSTGQLPQPPTVNEGAARNAAKSGGETAPDYSALTRYLFHFPDIRLEILPKGKVPYLAVNDTKKTGANEWLVPYSQESGSLTAATGIRQAWQRFEDRYYWRANVELNNPALYITNCLLDLSIGLQTNAVRTIVTVSPSDVANHKDINGNYPFNSPDTIQMDSYFPWPQVKKNDYCAGLNSNILPEIPLMYLPGICFLFFGAPTGVCIEGDRSNITNPLAPAPLYFNMAEARKRVANAVKKAHTDYLKEYQDDVVKALFNQKNKYFFPLPWHSLVPGDGAVVAPVMNQSVTPKPVTDLGTLIRQKYQGQNETRLYALNSTPYLFQSVYRSPTLSLHTLPNRKDVLASPPGVWLFEEYKRTLPVTNLPFQERIGYATFFMAYNEMKAALLPESVTGKALRPLLYQATGILQDVFYATPVPQPMRIPEYMAGLPYAGVQTRYDWKSVPEGYGIPRVTGEPVIKYEQVIR
ncbi:hypothetical protein [Deinococcus humi]|uniref:Uncharacterized protein n=1 Tax=Deinococcus humi TaxID=662880 RepID=A0A7W8K083_9DEIO|nr:hypothetical protein [Deinococcus humi]MBB5366250.1 hypothetical protein [Deinococcus humi]GGO40867.1 hypothetical protein GCM10008949_50880 [Deinococcus humi]